MANLDPLFGIHADALKLRSQRMEVLASNLANADTPNFKARELDFKSALEQAASSAGFNLSTARTNPTHVAVAATAGGAPGLVYRIPLQPSTDGNTVEVPQEQAAFAENALQYQASLSFIERRLEGLLLAIRGE
ncbi:MAG: flagellar basal body rod protein FlgB [Gammaproteobacteria bacterium]|nr:flagellar basal body rod protein FlgB [Gammaproteobacteria bacterium]